MENAEVRKPKYGNESTPVIFQNAIQLIMGKKDAVLITDFGVGTTARSLVRTATEINHIHSIFKHALSNSWSPGCVIQCTILSGLRQKSSIPVKNLFLV